MSGRGRALQAVRDVGLGVGIVWLVVLLTFWGSLAAVQAVFLVMTIAVLFWMATTRVDQLRGPAGWPRPLLFGGLAGLAAINASAFSFTGFTVLLLSTAVLGIALIVGIGRVLRRIGG
ncbi:MAG: hypothetical protein OEM81_01900 [Acidimicrobiia bacterium]|nr:hypothetical protein [Acidimicrobiia bacterium]MDH3396564.1 hypothetical protein [Acidimicrobiia bacterium]